MSWLGETWWDKAVRSQSIIWGKSVANTTVCYLGTFQCCKKFSKKTPNLLTTIYIKEQAFFTWLDAQGDISSKCCVCWVQETFCFYTVFSHKYSYCFFHNKHKYDNNFPKIMSIFSFPSMHAFFCPRGSLWWSFLVDDPNVIAGSLTPGASGRTLGLVDFQFSFLHNRHCAVPRVSRFWRISIVLAHWV